MIIFCVFVVVLLDTREARDYLNWDNTSNNGNLNDSTSIDYHHRRNWFNG